MPKHLNINENQAQQDVHSFPGYFILLILPSYGVVGGGGGGWTFTPKYQGAKGGCKKLAYFIYASPPPMVTLLAALLCFFVEFVTKSTTSDAAVWIVACKACFDDNSIL